MVGTKSLKRVFISQVSWIYPAKVLKGKYRIQQWKNVCFLYAYQSLLAQPSISLFFVVEGALKYVKNIL